MSNLLLQPSSWSDDAGVQPPSYWNAGASRYEMLISSPTDADGVFRMYLNSAPAEAGDYLAFDLAVAVFSPAPSHSGWLNVVNNGDVVHSVQLTGAPTTYRVEVPLAPGDYPSLVLSGYVNDYNTVGFYDFEATIIPLRPAGVPVANDDTATTPENTPVNVPVLANDTFDGSPVALGDLTGPPTIVTPPAQGTAVVQPDGTVTYTPPPGFCGQVTFEYQIEAPDAPAGACLCVSRGEGLSIFGGVPDTFDRGLPLTVHYADACSAFEYFDSAWYMSGGGTEDCWNDLYEIPPGVTVTISQGEQSVQLTTCTLDATRMGTNLDGSWWGPQGSVGDTLVLTFDGIDYPATNNGVGWVFADDELPVPFTMTAWDALVVVNQYEQDPVEVHYCGSIARQCFVYANNVDAWGGSGNASNLQRAAIGNIPAWLAAAFDNGSGIEITFEGETEATYYDTDAVAAYYVGGPNPSGPVSGVGLIASSLTGESSCLSYYIPEGS